MFSKLALEQQLEQHPPHVWFIYACSVCVVVLVFVYVFGTYFYSNIF